MTYSEMQFIDRAAVATFVCLALLVQYNLVAGETQQALDLLHAGAWAAAALLVVYMGSAVALYGHEAYRLAKPNNRGETV